MKTMYIVAPTYQIARDFLDSKKISLRNVLVVVDKNDVHRLYGLDCVTITILNKADCKPELINQLNVLSTVGRVKLEIENV